MGKRHEIDPRAEFQRAEFGDRRLNERLLTMFDAVVDAPSRSFPSAMPSDAQLESTYRFFMNEKVTLDVAIVQRSTRTAPEYGHVVICNRHLTDNELHK